MTSLLSRELDSYHFHVLLLLQSVILINHSLCRYAPRYAQSHLLKGNFCLSSTSALQDKHTESWQQLGRLTCSTVRSMGSFSKVSITLKASRDSLASTADCSHFCSSCTIFWPRTTSFRVPAGLCLSTVISTSLLSSWASFWYRRCREGRYRASTPPFLSAIACKTDVFDALWGYIALSLIQTAVACPATPRKHLLIVVQVCLS